VEDNGPFDANPVKGLITDPAGPGRASATPTPPPGQPLNPVASAGDTAATVSWGVPDTGGSPLRFTVSASPGGQQCTTLAEQTRCSVTGLTNGVAYRFTVVAENAGGAGSPSLLSNAVTPVTIDNGTDPALCGPAHAVATMQPPSSALCAMGEPAAVRAENGGFSWLCQLPGTATASLCKAPGARIPGGGTVSFDLQPGSGCAVETAQMSAPSVTAPQGSTLPFGIAGLRLTHCTAPIATVNMSFSESVTGMTLWQWIRQTWTPLPTAVLSGKSARFSIEDNGPYDANPQAGDIENAIGPGSANGKAGQPALSLRLRKTTLKSGQFATLNVRGGRGRGKISFSTQSSGVAQCKVSMVGHNPLLFVKSKTNGASCSVWAIKDGDKTYNATASNSMMVKVTVGGR
jgi:hypothetical protein